MKHIILAYKITAILLLILTTMFGPALLAAYVAGLNGIPFPAHMYGVCLVFGVFLTAVFLGYFLEKYM